jgi:hypothetical protein
LFGKDSNETAQRLQVVRIVGFMFAAQICCVSGFAAFASTLVKLTTLWHLDSTRAGGLLGGVLIADKFDTIGIDMTVPDDALHCYRLAGIWRRELHGNLITDQKFGREKYLHAAAIQF